MADELDAKCQLVEAKTDLDQITTFPGVLRSGDWMIQVFWEWSLPGCVDISEGRSEKQVTWNTNAQGRFSLYEMWIEYEGPMANSCAEACNLV